MEPLFVYLDWNVVDGISKGRFPALENLLRAAKEKKLIRLPFSQMHGYEACNIAPDIPNRDELKSNNLDAIYRILGTDYFELSDDSKNIICWQHDPREFFKDVDNLHLFNPVVSSMLLALEPIRLNSQSFGLSALELNNIEDPEELIARIDSSFAEPKNYETYKHFSPSPITLREILLLSHQLLVKITTDNNKELAFMSHIITTMDLLGFHSDRVRVPDKRIAIWLDAYHAFWGGYCSVFVSDDRRLRQKTKVAYHLLEKTTIVADTHQAKNILTGILSTSH